MTQLNVNWIEPLTGNTLSLGEVGDTIVMSQIKTNSVKDTGGNEIWTCNSAGDVTSKADEFTGSLHLLQTNEVTTGVTSIDFYFSEWSYNVFMFKCFEIHSTSTDADAKFGFLTSTTSANSGINWGQTASSTFFRSYHDDDNIDGNLDYESANHVENSTSLIPLAEFEGGVNWAGELTLFKPSSTECVKNFTSRGTHCNHLIGSTTDRRIKNTFVSGFIMTAADDTKKVRFKMSSGLFTGLIKLYGLVN